MTDHALPWGKYAGQYGCLNELMSYRLMLARAVLAAQIQDGMTVFDAGCGPLNIVNALMAAGVKCHLIGVDATPGMLEVAAYNALRYREYGGKTTLIQANLNDPATWNIRSESIDAVLAINSLYATTHPHQAVTNLIDRLRPASYFVLSTPGRIIDPDAAMKAVLVEHMAAYMAGSGTLPYGMEQARIKKLVGPLITINKDILSDPRFHFVPPDVVRSWLTGLPVDLIEFGGVYGLPSQNHFVVAKKHGSIS